MVLCRSCLNFWNLINLAKSISVKISEILNAMKTFSWGCCLRILSILYRPHWNYELCKWSLEQAGVYYWLGFIFLSSQSIGMKWGTWILNTPPKWEGIRSAVVLANLKDDIDWFEASSYEKNGGKFCGKCDVVVVVQTHYSKPLCVYGSLC